MDVHAGGQLHIHAVVDHLLAHLGGERFDQLRVPGAGQGRAAGLQRAVFFQAQTGRAVGGDDRRNAFASQTLGHAAEGARVARHAEGTSHHAVAPAEGFQLLVVQPGNKIVQRDLAALHVIQRIAPEPGDRDGFRQTAQDPLPQLSAGFAELLALLHRDLLFQRKAARLGVVYREAVFAALQHEAAAVLVIGGQALVVTAQPQGLTLAGREVFCLGKGNENAYRLIQSSRRRMAPELYDLLPGDASDVRDGDYSLRFVSSMAQAFGFQSKARVAQAEAEGIEHLVGVPVEVPIAHVDALDVVVIRLAAEVRAAGIVLIAAGDRVAELAAWRHVPGEHVRHGVAALHAALPDDHQGGELVPVFLRPGQVHDIADVQQHHDPGKGCRDRVQHGSLLIGQIVAAFGKRVLPIFSCGAADHHQRGLGGLRGLSHQGCVQRHLGVVHGPMAPPAVIRHVVLLLCPDLIGIQEFIVHPHTRIAQAVGQVHMIGRVHIAAAAIANIEPIKLAASENSDFFFPVQRQHAVVFQQHAALGSRLTDEFPDPGCHIAFTVGPGLLLHQAVSHGPVNDTLGQFSQSVFQLFHSGTPCIFMIPV